MIETTVGDRPMSFKTHPKLFSPNRPDPGTLAMLSVANIQSDDKVLDLGCGYGLVGIYAANIVGPEQVVMTDIEPLAVALAEENARLNRAGGIRVVRGDAYEAIDDSDFTIILSNPPYHADFSVPKRMIEKGFNRLTIGGRLLMVTKRKAWYKNKLIAIFGGVRIHEINGYFVFEAQKRSGSFAKSRK